MTVHPFFFLKYSMVFERENRKPCASGRARWVAPRRRTSIMGRRASRERDVGRGTATVPTTSVGSERLSWELATESIVVRIRWFGIAMGYILALTRTGLHSPSAVC